MFAPITAEDGFDIPLLNRLLDQAKTAVFVNDDAAFFGPLLSTMEIIWTLDVPTAATNGEAILWNPNDFLELDVPARKSTIIHELRHVADFHFIRKGNRDPADWNIAGDYVINADLEFDGYAVPDPYFIKNSKYRGWSVEDTYDDIHDPNQCAPWGPGNTPGPPNPNGSGTPAPGMPGGNQGQGKPVRSLQGDLLPATPEQAQKAVNNVVQAAHAAVAAGQPGAIPGNTQLLIKKFLKPIVAWESLLDRFFVDLHNDDFTWRRPNRRFQDVYLPSHESAQRLTHLIYYLDVSGSVSDADIVRFNSEVKHIKDKYNPEKLTLVQFDTKIQDEIVIMDNDQFNGITVSGRGGTDLRPVREHIMQHKPAAAIIFSDLYVEPMLPGPKCPIIWVTVGNRSARVNFGKIIHIRNEAA